MTDRDAFYAARDPRTVEYGVAGIFERPVAVHVGMQTASTMRGQLATLALVNMLARMHRVIHLDIPSVAILRPTLVPADRFDDAVHLLAHAIDPFIEFIPRGERCAAIGLGIDAPPGLPCYAGATRQVAIIDRDPVPMDEDFAPSLGAALAACMAASAILNQVLGRAVPPARVSAWDLSDDAGPAVLGSLDVGAVLQVGAGGVGSCLAYWLREFGVHGDWRTIDGDRVALHNTNRSLGLLARDAAWPAGDAVAKAAVAAGLTGSQSACCWYDDFDHDAFTPDLILPLANERGVRQAVAARGQPILLHATTSRGWEAQLHRHIPGRDDCIVCRIPPAARQVELQCATVPLPGMPKPSTDAALPFLSASAALLLLSGLYRLQHGALAADPNNLWALRFQHVRGPIRRARHRCADGCQAVMSPPVRRRIHASRRWSRIDAEAHLASEQRGHPAIPRLVR
jgi:molybdopterin/thiamine biosynthesis adenylyltransferase